MKNKIKKLKEEVSSLQGKWKPIPSVYSKKDFPMLIKKGYEISPDGKSIRKKISNNTNLVENLIKKILLEDSEPAPIDKKTWMPKLPGRTYDPAVWDISPSGEWVRKKTGSTPTGKSENNPNLVENLVRRILLEAEIPPQDGRTWTPKLPNRTYDPAVWDISPLGEWVTKKTGGAPTGGAPTGGAPTGGAPTGGGIIGYMWDAAAGVWNGVTSIATTGIKEVAGIANNAIDETAKLLGMTGAKVFKVGGKLYSDFTGSLASLTSGGANGTATALPKWVDNHPCLKLQNIIGSGNNAIVASKQTQKTYTLSEDGTYFDSDSNKGKWKCKDNTTVTFESSTEKITSNLVGGAGSRQGGGGGCTIDTFPRCVQGFTFDPNNCTTGGIAKKGDLYYNVLYTNQKYSDVAKNITSTEIEYACYIYEPNSSKGQIGRYSCMGESINIVSDAYGELKGTNQSIRKAYTTADYGTMAKAYGGEMVGKFLIADTDKNQLLGVNDNMLIQSIETIKDYISQGYRGISLNGFINFLINLQSLISRDGIPASEEIKETIQLFFTYMQNTGTDNKKWDPKYQMNVDPSPNDMPMYSCKSCVATINQEPFNGFKLYRHQNFLNSPQVKQRLTQYQTQTQQTGITEQDCKDYLDLWISQVVGEPNRASRKWQKTQSTNLGNELPEDQEANYKEQIQRCARAGRYEARLLNREYQNIINYIAQLPENEGGITFGRTAPSGSTGGKQ